jgi:RNase P/RNase MRP subunit POP5
LRLKVKRERDSDAKAAALLAREFDHLQVFLLKVRRSGLARNFQRNAGRIALVSEP